MRGDPPRPRWANAALIAAPLAWAVHLGASYALVRHACRMDRGWVFPVIWLVALIVSIVALAAVWKERRLVHGDSVDRDTSDQRHFAAFATVAVTAFFAWLVLVTGIPAFMVGPCR